MEKNKVFLPEDDSIPDTSKYEGMTTEELELLLEELENRNMN